MRCVLRNPSPPQVVTEDLTGRKLRGPIGEREDYWRRGEAGGIAAEPIRDLEPDGANRSIVRGSCRVRLEVSLEESGSIPDLDLQS